MSTCPEKLRWVRFWVLATWNKLDRNCENGVVQISILGIVGQAGLGKII